MFADPDTLPERSAETAIARNYTMPVNLEAHLKAPHQPKPGEYADAAAVDLEAKLVIAEASRGNAADYDYALSDLSTEIGDMALAELDGADVEAIARDVIERLRAKAKSHREAATHA